MRWLPALLLLFAVPVSAADLLFAGGQWVALDRGPSCEAGSRSLRIAQKGKVQARAGFAFDAAGRRRGQFFAQLSRMPRQGSTVIAAVRAAGGMRIDSRDQVGGRFVDRYLLEGAPTAIDAAAARCAGKMQRR